MQRRVETLNIHSEVIHLLNKKLDYFEVFQQIASLKGELGCVPQYKTEKWFQAELLVHLWSRSIKCIPEYNSKRWDIFIPKIAKARPIYLALKCFTDSNQPARKDFHRVLKDIETVLEHDVNFGAAYLILLLPLNRNVKYSERMLDLLRTSNNPKRFKFCLDEIKFKETEPTGVLVCTLTKA